MRPSASLAVVFRVEVHAFHKGFEFLRCRNRCETKHRPELAAPIDRLVSRTSFKALRRAMAGIPPLTYSLARHCNLIRPPQVYLRPA